ncbi:Pre2p/proteasome subunit beta type 5 [Cryptosporidium ryanae]|uniref:Pre2p/proteasome subunit beta type 5 n=1 Tax=Cryptosporidium ryanae TaxID=515981 RepID=UPI00351A3529|nr:Pre2p/proteasome subunit beta type 5 [Cryptosporidium ryanae]
MSMFSFLDGSLDDVSFYGGNSLDWKSKTNSNLFKFGQKEKDDEFLEKVYNDVFEHARVGDPCNFVRDYNKGELKKRMNRGTTTLGFIYQGGVILAVDSRATQGSYIASQEVKKIIKINDFLLGTMAGGAADCSYWERFLSKLCRLYELRNNQRISVAGASKILTNIFFHYRAYGLSAGVMIAGYDHDGPHLYYVDNDGSRVKDYKFSIGSGSLYAYGILDTGYRYDLTDQEAIELGSRAIVAATNRDGGSGGLVRVYQITSAGITKHIEGSDVSKLHYSYFESEGKDPCKL